MLERVLEPELMVTPEQARAYSEADFSSAHQSFVEHFRAHFPRFVGGRVIDLGCGPADVLVRFANALPRAELWGVDGSDAMLTLGRARIERAGLANRVHIERHVLPESRLVALGVFDAVISNSILHHLHNPDVLWSTIREVVAPGAPIFVMDLMRPTSRDALHLLVETYAGTEPEVLRTDFRNSLGAAFTPDEVRRQLRHAGFEHLSVEPVSDRHLVVAGVAVA